MGVRRYPDTGGVRTRGPAEPERASAGSGMPRVIRSPTLTEGEYSCSVSKDGPRSAAPQRASVPHARASLWDGLPDACASDLDHVLDNRLGSSSLRSMSAALRFWFATCALYSFDVIVETDDPCRGGRAVAFVLYMMTDTSLVWASIENYIWAWREWMVLQRQADPVMGVMNWDRFLAAVRVLTAVPSEPRLALPLADLVRILAVLDLDDFYEVQFGLLLLVVLYTFSRSECPMPKALDGFDPQTHWRFCDLRLAHVAGHLCLWVRFKAIKQDRRMERPTAQPLPDEPGESGDWAHVGDVADPVFSVATWARRLLLFGVQRGRDDPFFLHRDRVKPLTYGATLDFLRVLQRRAGVSEVPGLHGIRVTGNNLSRNANGDELTQFHGGWLSASGRSRYDRFAPLDVVSIPARMLGLPAPGQAAPAVRQVTRFSHLRRGGPDAGDPVQRLVLPERGEVDRLLASRSAAGAGSSGEAGVRAQAPHECPAVSQLERDARGSGVVLPAGYVCEERTARNPRSERSRHWKVYVAPDGTELLSRPAAWRHAASVGVAAESSSAASAPRSAARSPDGSSPRAPASLGEEISFPSCYEACPTTPAPPALPPAGVAHRPVGPARRSARRAEDPSRSASEPSHAQEILSAAREGRRTGAGSRLLRELA